MPASSRRAAGKDAVVLYPSTSQISQEGPINRLPPDILQRIFRLCDTVNRPMLHVRTLINLECLLKTPAAYSWLPLAEVCRRWYRECAECTFLWSLILLPDIRNKSFLQLCLRRSKQRPLLVTYYDARDEALSQDSQQVGAADGTERPCSPAIAMLEIVLSQAHRIEELCLDTFLLNERIIGKLVRLGTNIHRCILGSRLFAEGTQPCPSVRFPFDDADYPVLRHLCLQSPFVPSWNSIARLTSLVELDIRIASRDIEPVVIRADDVLQCLNTLTNLQALSFSDPAGVLRLALGDQLKLPLVKLARVRLLKLLTRPDFATFLMEHVRIPPSSSLFIQYTQSTNMRDDTHSMVAPLLSRYAAGGDEELPETLHIVDGSDVRTLHGSYDTFANNEPYDSWYRDHFSMHIRWPRWPGSLVDTVRRLPTERVHTLRVTCGIWLDTWRGPRYDLAEWAECLPGVKKLELPSFGRPNCFFPVQLAQLGERLPSGSYPWPGLEVLQLKDLPVCNERLNREMQLWEILPRREAGGCLRLRQVVIKDSVVGREKEQVELLRACADEVVIPSTTSTGTRESS